MEAIKKTLLNMLPSIGYALLIAAIGVLLVGIIARIVRKSMTRAKADPSLVRFFVRMIRFTGYTLVIIMALSRLGVSTAGLVASLTAVLAAIALALKDSLSDIAGGIIILFSRPFVTGDFIEFGEHRGTVQKIGMMHTDILTYDDTNVVIPNSRLTTGEVNNYTAHSETRVLISVPVGYSADVDLVKRVLTDVMAHTEYVITEAPHQPRAHLEQYGDSALMFSAKCWCAFEHYWTVYYSLTEEIKKALDEHGITIPFNQLDVHIAQDHTSRDDKTNKKT